MSAPAPIDKYRPVLTAEQITHICTLARLDATEKSFSLLASLAMFEYKIKQGAITPAYTEKPRTSLSTDLGFELGVEEKVTTLVKQQLSARDSESLYQQWLTNPDGFSIDGLKSIQFYRYQTGKMMQHEERKYESEVLGLR